MAPRLTGHDNLAMPIFARLTLLTAVVAASVPSPGSAEPQVRPQEPDEVVVTASRFRRPDLDYGGSVTRLGTADLAFRAATHYADVLNLVPGVQLQRGSGQEGLIAIRSPVLTGAGACGAFLVLEDGIPLRPPGFCNVNELFELNIEQAAAIEVLRGPGSAAFGANTVHGIVNVLSRDLDSADRARVALRGGEFDLRQLAIEATTRLDPDTTAGFNALLRHDGGFRADSGTDEGKINLRLRHIGATGLWTWTTSATQLDQETAGFIRGFDSYRDPVQARANANPEAFRDAWSARSSLRHDAMPCEGCERSAYALLRGSGMRFLQHFLLGKPLERNSHLSVALGSQWSRPLGNEHRGQWGFDASHMRVRLLQAQPGPTLEGSAAARAIRPAGRHYEYRVAGTTLGINGELDFVLPLAQRLVLQGHLGRTRYGYDNRLSDGNRDEFGNACGFGGCLYNRPADRSDQFDDLAARIEWQVPWRDDRLWYLSLARGFRPPETTELYRLQRGQDVTSLDSEYLVGAETGLRLRRGRWRAAIALYAQDKRNVLLRDANGFNIDGGRTRHHGLEYEIELNATDRWRVEFAGSWALHRYAFNRIIEGGEAVVSGREIDTAPRLLTRLALEWRGPHSTGAGLHAQHVGRYYVDASSARRYPGHVVATLWAAWTPKPEHVLRLQVENLFDRRYADRADFAQGEYRYFPGTPRQVTLEYRWSRR